VLPIMASVLVVILVSTLGLARLGDAAVRRARVDSVADVVALAAVHDGRGGAERVASAAGGSVLEHRQAPDGSVQVLVGLGALSAAAAAAPLGAELDSGPEPTTGRR